MIADAVEYEPVKFSVHDWDDCPRAVINSIPLLMSCHVNKHTMKFGDEATLNIGFARIARSTVECLVSAHLRVSVYPLFLTVLAVWRLST